MHTEFIIPKARTSKNTKILSKTAFQADEIDMFCSTHNSDKSVVERQIVLSYPT
jgi:hypothetical protein